MATSTPNTRHEAARLRRHYLIWIALTLCAFLPMPYVLSLNAEDGQGTALLPSHLVDNTNLDALGMMQIFSALVAFTSAFVILLRYSALGNRLYLLIGLGFLVAGAEDLLHGLIVSTWFHSLPDVSWLTFSSYVAARVFLVVTFFIAFVSARLPRDLRNVKPRRLRRILRLAPESRHTRILIASFGVITVVAAVLLAPTLTEQDVSRPVDLLLGILFVAATPLAIQHYRENRGSFQASLVLCLLLVIYSQFYACSSTHLFDPSFVAAHSFKLCCYVVPLIGTAKGLLEQHEKLCDHRRQLENQAALMWQQSNSLIEANRLLKQQTSELEEVARLKSQFLSNMSHELRTPLNAINGFSESVLECRDTDPLTDWQADRLQKIGTSGEHLLRLINDILDLAKIEAGKLTIQVTSFYLDELITEISDLLVPLFEKKPALTLKVDVEHARQIVELDRDKMKQVITNLLGNACKFTEIGEVRVAATISGGCLTLEVTDSGPGIAEEHQELIFDQFEQVDGGSTRKVGGTGLGLALVKQLVELMGGEVSLTSELGVGSTFRVTLLTVYQSVDSKRKNTSRVQLQRKPDLAPA